MKNRTRSSKLEFCSLPCLLRAVSRQETTATKKIRNETTLHTPTHHTICVGDGSQRTRERQCVSVVGCAGGGGGGGRWEEVLDRPRTCHCQTFVSCSDVSVHFRDTLSGHFRSMRMSKT